MNQERFQKVFVVLLLVFISAGFVAMIRPFVLTILLAAIFAGVLQPVHGRILRLVRGQGVIAASFTLILFLVVVVGPLLSALGIVANEAYNVSQSVVPWVQKMREGTLSLEGLESLPLVEEIRPHWSEIVARGSQLVASGSRFLVEKLSSVTRGTVTFVFQFVVFLYSMFFFLKDGRSILERLLYYLPLDDADERRMVGKFASVTRAMLKGTITIAVLQGSLTGIALAVVGIKGAIFWGTLAIFLAMIPGVGAPVVWLPGVVYLFATGHTGRAIFLLAFCAGIVGTLDNFLKPRLVGRDTQMHDLMVFLGILGGITLFGLAGFIVGPILAALFVTIWDIYAVVFKDHLPKVAWIDAERDRRQGDQSPPDGPPSGSDASPPPEEPAT